MSNAQYILDHLTEAELLTQLAEEAAELAQAALKRRRAITGDNPTPVPPEEATDRLVEEIDDVDCCILLTLIKKSGVMYREDSPSVEFLDDRFPKMARWRARLEAKTPR